MILIVADTNIFINAIFSNGYRNDEKILQLEEDLKIKFAFSAVTKNEIYKIIARTVEKRDVFECSDFFELIHAIVSRSAFIEKPPKLEKLSSDKGDQPFIELANAVHANYLVTNDYQNGLLDLKTYNNLTISTSSAFIKDYDRINRKKRTKE